MFVLLFPHLSIINFIILTLLLLVTSELFLIPFAYVSFLLNFNHPQL